VKSLALSKEHKAEVIAQYKEWATRSRGLFVADYKGLTMKDIDILRGRMREVGGEFHIVKNTLSKLAFESAGYPIPDRLFEGSTAIAFAFEDVPATAKTLAEFARTTEFLKFKGGYLGKEAISGLSVQALADLPPLPVVRAKLLGTLLAPASQLARVLAEPARMVAAVVKAYSERESNPVAV
jgi:large subunit ribosomal protein L10